MPAFKNALTAPNTPSTGPTATIKPGKATARFKPSNVPPPKGAQKKARC